MSAVLAMEHRSEITPWHWSLWAQYRRGNLPAIGYPRAVPWYTPPRLGDVAVERRDDPTSDDWAFAERMDRLVNRHRGVRPAEVVALEIYEGAYLQAHPSRRQRCHDWGIQYESCRRMANRAKRAVEVLL